MLDDDEDGGGGGGDDDKYDDDNDDSHVDDDDNFIAYQHFGIVCYAFAQLPDRRTYKST